MLRQGAARGFLAGGSHLSTHPHPGEVTGRSRTTQADIISVTDTFQFLFCRDCFNRLSARSLDFVPSLWGQAHSAKRPTQKKTSVFIISLDFPCFAYPQVMLVIETFPPSLKPSL